MHIGVWGLGARARRVKRLTAKQKVGDDPIL